MQKFKKKEINILIDGRLLSNKPTGISRYTLELIRAYNRKLGVDNVTVILPIGYNPEFENVTIKCKLLPYNIFHFLLFPFFINLKKFDLLHSPFYSAIWLKLYKTKVVCTVHDLMYCKVDHFFAKNSIINFLAKKYYNLIVGVSLKNADKVIAVSQTTQRDLTDFFAISSIVNSEGVNTSAVNSFTESVFDFRDHNINPGEYFLYVGNSRPHKNLEFLYKVFSRYFGRYDLVIVGNDGNLNIKNSRIKYFKYLDDRDLADLYKHAKAFIYPSLYEGFGLPVLEALQNTCLVFSSNAGALAEFKFKSIYFFDPLIEDELLDLLNRVDKLKFDSKDFELLKSYDWANNLDILITTIQSFLSFKKE